MADHRSRRIISNAFLSEVKKEDIPWLFKGPSLQEVEQTICPKLEFFVEGTQVRCRSSTDEGSCLYPPAQEEPVTGQPSSKETRSDPGSSNLLSISAVIPKRGVSRTPIQISFTFTNKTDSSLPLGLSIGNNNNFMFSGNKQINLSLEPMSSHTEIYILYPLICGLVNIPRLRLVVFPDTPEAQPMDSLVDSAVTQFIQIMPKGC